MGSVPRQRLPRCAECGYDLNGLKVDGVCPECGLLIRKCIALHEIRVSKAAKSALWLSLSSIPLLCIGVVPAVFGLYWSAVARREYIEGRATRASYDMAGKAQWIACIYLVIWTAVILAPRCVYLRGSP